ncbi:MAG TPA: low specificity L-threonine aldolase [Candidatus Eisenbergiella merdipullorum]|uniref:Low specificity L-threonine aldolase n=1 Tax=Candidatus Eisenbergiella merdipullorum TaxID=2838553 RepID=A0A9D2I4D0_9FIRM|nr:low specificity L-threonine aldolase [Candidatus Eisenbergiella merdipullorum]
MILFQCDYNEGAHPKVMEKLMKTNLEQTVGYGEDEHCAHAADLIRKACKDDSLAVHFLVGGTQTNMTVIAAALRPHQGVISAQTGHINAHETGAVESVGHKVLALPQTDGKISASQVAELCEAHLHDASFEHLVQPKMVYISNPTEYGTLYSRKELEEMSEVCRRYGLYLFLDGARLGYGLAAADNELDLPLLARCCDVFYIGGTKVGALFGEAVVMSNEDLKKDFRYLIKQKGGMLAKGRLLGVQFEALFEDGLYMEISRHADRLADKLREAFVQAGFPLLVESRTNQIFPVMPDPLLEKLAPDYGFSYQERVDKTHSAVRFCTSWATKEENVDRLIADLKRLARAV